MFGEYIRSGQGTVDTIRLQDGRTVQVSAVDGWSNPHCHCAHTRSNLPARPNDIGSEAGVAMTVGIFLGVPAALLVGSIWGYYRGKSGK